MKTISHCFPIFLHAPQNICKHANRGLISGQMLEFVPTLRVYTQTGIGQHLFGIVDLLHVLRHVVGNVKTLAIFKTHVLYLQIACVPLCTFLQRFLGS